MTAQGESWEALNAMWAKGRNGIKDSGLGVKDRRYVSGVRTYHPRAAIGVCDYSDCRKREGLWDVRYVLWALARYSQGERLADFIRPATPAKKYRG